MFSPRILIADEDATHRKLVTLLSKKVSVEADTVSRCEDVLRAVEANRYSLVLIDLGVPRIAEAIQCIREIRAAAHRQHRYIPIIALTAHAMPEDRELCLKGGADDYLSKPFSCRDFNRVIDYWIRESQRLGRRVS